MDVIPVLDLKQGRPVHAVRGERHSYRPLDVPGCRDGDPLAAVAAYLAMHDFATLYVADLDAIAGAAGHDETLEDIRRRHGGLTLMVDNGIADEAAARAWLARGLGRLVIGSENHPAPDLARRLGAVLSLDWRGPTFCGPAGLADTAEDWPDEVIAMTLARVGSGEGPDLDRLAAVLALAGGRRVLAAGGVRGTDDLEALARLGVAGMPAGSPGPTSPASRRCGRDSETGGREASRRGVAKMVKSRCPTALERSRPTAATGLPDTSCREGVPVQGCCLSRRWHRTGA